MYYMMKEQRILLHPQNSPSFVSSKARKHLLDLDFKSILPRSLELSFHPFSFFNTEYNTDTTTESHGIKSFNRMPFVTISVAFEYIRFNAHDNILCERWHNLMLNMNIRFKDIEIPLVIYSLRLNGQFMANA